MAVMKRHGMNRRVTGWSTVAMLAGGLLGAACGEPLTIHIGADSGALHTAFVVTVHGSGSANQQVTVSLCANDGSGAPVACDDAGRIHITADSAGAFPAISDYKIQRIPPPSASYGIVLADSSGHVLDTKPFQVTAASP